MYSSAAGVRPFKRCTHACFKMVDPEGKEPSVRFNIDVLSHTRKATANTYTRGARYQIER